MNRYLLLLAVSIILGEYTGVLLAQTVDAVYVKGEITEKVATDAITRIRGGTRYIVINSYGGEEAAAIRLANEMHRYKMMLLVDHVCLSSCAQYILPSAHKAIINNNSIVGFHTSSYALSKRIRLKSRMELRNYVWRDTIAGNSAATISLYRDVGVDLRILDRSWLMTDPICVDVKNGVIRVKYLFWIPEKDELIKDGFRVSGYWPKTRIEAQTLVSKYFKLNTLFRFGSSQRKERVMAKTESTQLLCGPPV